MKKPRNNVIHGTIETVYRYTLYLNDKPVRYGSAYKTWKEAQAAANRMMLVNHTRYKEADIPVTIKLIEDKGN
jgi:hypothetical protein